MVGLAERLAVPAEQLRTPVDPSVFDFETTADLKPLEGIIGQERALEALDFGLTVRAANHHVFVAGPPGTGRNTAVRQVLQRVAAARPAPPDWCYVYNFANPDRPVALALPPGLGPQLAADLETLIASCRRELTRAFEGEAYAKRRQEIEQQVSQAREALGRTLREAADRLGFALEITPYGVATIPLREGRPLRRDEYEALPAEEQAAIRARGQQMEQVIEEAQRVERRLVRDATERLSDLDREVARYAIGHLFAELRQRYQTVPRVGAYLDQVRDDLVEHQEALRSREPTHVHLPGIGEVALGDFEQRYRVNVLVTRSEPGAPVAVEPNPTYYNLVGRVEYAARLGAMVTDFTLIKPGALHRANGGYLILQARDVLTAPLAWDALKRALRDHEIRVENLGEQFSAFPTVSLKPEPIPLDVKVVLVGDPLLYTLLYALDEDFPKLFKVKAEFSPELDRTPESLAGYAAFVAKISQTSGLRPFHRTAVARIAEHGARLREHRDRLTGRFSAIADLVAEADFCAGEAGAPVVQAEHVATAIERQERRASLLEERLRREIGEGTLRISTSGAVVGQVNGLSVLDLGDYAFARPSRITARIGLGDEGVINIEREIERSGPAHSKGVLTLSGYLVGQYVQEVPLALTASLAFEQVYDEVEGDSASSAELYALLSSLADLPLDQGIAVTGSVNQRGEIQAVGGVNLKIEGFFRTCQAAGLTGTQGVIIPRANVRHLMLKDDVVEAVRAGRFHVWAVDTVDQGIELLTGVPAGERGPDGRYPEGTVHARVLATLTSRAERLRQFGPAAARAVPDGRSRHHAARVVRRRGGRARGR